MLSNGHENEKSRNVSKKGTGKTLVDVIASGTKCIWSKRIENTQMEKFKSYINQKYRVELVDYWDLHKWSVNNYKTFWGEIWGYFDVIHSKTFDEVVTDAECFIDVEWFRGAKMNFAENLLRYRDERTALLYHDEEDRVEKVSYSELYENVKRYAHALRLHGLKKGDYVACYMSNRLEAVYVQLAASSIGAVFGGPSPFYGKRAATHVLNELKPKFLFTTDRFVDEGLECNLLENLKYIGEAVQSLQKIIIVPNRTQTSRMSISSIKNSCYSDDFLPRSGDTISDLVFEQLPCNHPLFISFTSGTTGLPKGLIHSTGYLLYKLVQYALHDDVGRDDVMMECLPVGWNVWNGCLTVLALGGTVLFFNGTPYYKSETYFWDIISKHRVTITWFVPSIIDKMDKQNVLPRGGRIPNHVRRLTLGGSPAKLQNFEYFERIKHDYLFLGCAYGATETVGCFTGCDMNLPAYSGEIQVPALGVDMHCFDEEGNSVVGKKGEVVLRKPLPSMPVGFLMDRKIFMENYFSKFKGFYTQNDECWQDPKTKGWVVIGRSDETLNQYGERFSSSDIYFAIHGIEELADYICVGQTSCEGDQRAVLFVKVKEGFKFTTELVKKIEDDIEQELDIEFVPQVILEAKDIPYNLNNKRMEKLVKTIIATNTIPEVANIKNPECLKYYLDIPELQNW